LPKPFYPAWIPGYPQTANHFTLLRLTADDGVLGLAAAVAFERERDGILTEPIDVRPDGTVPVPENPGLGIVLDEDKLAHFGEKFFEITSRGVAMKTIREKGLFTALRLARKRKR
jgi:L-alanine-DL-glutamate epimerase-like enolase superfamily enzyme